MPVRSSDRVGRFIDDTTRVHDEWLRREVPVTPNVHSVRFDFLIKTHSGSIIHTTPSFRLTRRLVTLWNQDLRRVYAHFRSDIFRFEDPDERKLVEWMEESFDFSHRTGKTLDSLDTGIKPLTPIERQKILDQKLSSQPLRPENGLPPLTSDKEKKALLLVQDATGKGEALHRRTCGLFSSVDLAKNPPPHFTRLTALLDNLGKVVAVLPICLSAFQFMQGENPTKILSDLSEGTILSILTPTFTSALIFGGIEWLLG